MSKHLKKKEAEQIASEIDVEGFDYWIENYSEKSLAKHPELLAMAKEAKDAMLRLEHALDEEGAISYL